MAEDEPCTSDGLHEVELLLPFIKDASAQGCNRKDVGGVLVFHGSVCSFAYLNSKEPISQAVADIKGDIITSLRSRLDIVCDETDGDPTLDVGIEATNVMSNVPTPHLNLQELRKTCSLSFPRRVFVPWLAGTYICDYLQPSETLEVCNLDKHNTLFDNLVRREHKNGCFNGVSTEYDGFNECHFLPLNLFFLSLSLSLSHLFFQIHNIFAMGMSFLLHLLKCAT